MVNIPSSVKALLAAGFVSVVMTPSAFAQSATGNEAAYHDLLQAISAKKISLAQNQMYVANQKTKIDSLNSQIAGLDSLKASIEPMVGKMTTGIARQIKSDYPFDIENRLARLRALEETVSKPGVGIGDKYRKALNIYKFEVNYGQGLEAIKGDHPITPTIREGDERYEKDENGKLKLDKNGNRIEVFDGSYLRYGRLAYVYMQADSSEALRYDLASKKWVKLPKSKIVDIRRAVRIASGEAAPTVVKVPVVKVQ